MIRNLRIPLVFGLLALSACSNPALEKKVADLEGKVTKLETDMAEMSKGRPKAADPALEEAAGKLFQEATEAAEAGRVDEAKAKLTELDSKYGETRAAKRAGRLKGELSVVGTEPGSLEVASWFQGDSSFSEGDATLVVFFETWCPHCQREVPKLEEAHNKYKAEGLNVIALTKVSRSSTDEKVAEFIKEHKISYPVGKEKDGSMSEKLAVQGIPAAAVVKDGKVVWRGHPARIDDDMIAKWIN